MMIALVLAALFLCHTSSFAQQHDAFEEDELEFMDMMAAAERGELPESHPVYLDYLRATGQDEEFARLLGIQDVSLVRPSDDARTEEDFIFTKVSPLGDILLTPEQEEQARSALNMDKYRGNKWKNNEVSYYISSDFPSREKQRMHDVFAAMDKCLENFTIRRWKSNDKDYVYIKNGQGCYSHLGKTGGQQPLSLQRNGCLSNGTMQHEMMHAIGFTHEHCRQDRDNHVTVKYENIPEDWHSQYDKVSDNDFILIGPYEHHSVMHYPMRAPGTNKMAFDIHDKTVDQGKIGQRNGVTELDCWKIDQLYKK